MKDLVSLRSEVSGVVEFFQIKTNKIKKVLLPGGMIFVTNRKRKNSSFGIKFAKAVKYVLKSQLGQVVHLQHGDEVDEGDNLVTVHSEIEGVIAIKKNKITVTKKSIVKEYEIDPKYYQVVVDEGANVKIGQVIAKVISPIYGIIKYNFIPPESEKDRIKKIDGLEVLQDAAAYEIPDDFLIKVSDGSEVTAGVVIAEGVIREDSYGDVSIEKESYEEEKDEEEETIAEEETEEVEEESKEEFNYDEERIDSEFDSEEEEPAASEDEEYQQSSFKKKKKPAK